MKVWEINQHLAQIAKIRRSLQADPVTPAGDITRPDKMKLYTFNNRIARLKRLEKLANDKIQEGGQRWIAQHYLK